LGREFYSEVFGIGEGEVVKLCRKGGDS